MLYAEWSGKLVVILNRNQRQIAMINTVCNIIGLPTFGNIGKGH